jgi:hypothetical protein
VLLKASNLVAQRGLRDVQARGGAAEVELLGDSHEVLHEPQV